MEGVEGEASEELLLPPEGPSPQKHHRRLKRLKKASEVADSPMRHSPASRPSEEVSRSQDDASGDGELPDQAVSEGRNGETDFDDGLDPLFGVRCRREESGVESLDSETEMEMSEDVGGLGDADGWTGERLDGPGKEISAKKRLSMEDGQEDSKRKKVGSGQRLSKDGKPMESARERKKLEKERKVYLEHLHAESQKLLRETRDASFKPVIIADKPISSVLEKIRRRKLELLKRSTVTNGADQLPHDPFLEASTAKDLRPQDENEKDPGEISRSEEDNPGSGVQEFADNSQHCDDEDDKSVDCINEIHDDNGVPSSIGVDLGHNSDASDDSSSEEEDYDKENINPCPDQPASVSLQRNNDLIKGFLDEEAEEEDDSDHDLMRFQDDDDDNDDDADSDEAELLNDLIAAGYKEKPLDAEKRNELHQRWLQHQDAAATDNLLQRLNSHAKQKSPFKIENEADDEEPEGDDSEPLSDPPPLTAARQNARQAKERMAQMFTDSEDAYLSDDEETEQRMLRGRLLLHQTVERSSALSPPEDEASREVFSLIRKLNTVPDTKRKPSSLTANFDTLAIRGSRSSSKPSFLGRTTGNPVTSSLRQGTSVSRSFVFGRDDSNSRGSDPPSETIPDAPGDRPPKTNNGPGRVSGSQAQSTVLRRTSSDDGASSASLFDILRRTSCRRVDQGSLTSSELTGDPISASQTARQFSAFRLSKKT